MGIAAAAAAAAAAAESRADCAAAAAAADAAVPRPATPAPLPDTPAPTTPAPTTPPAPYPGWSHGVQGAASTPGSCAVSAAATQGLTLVHFSAQLERFVWDRECAQGFCSPC